MAKCNTDGRARGVLQCRQPTSDLRRYDVDRAKPAGKRETHARDEAGQQLATTIPGRAASNRPDRETQAAGPGMRGPSASELKRAMAASLPSLSRPENCFASKFHQPCACVALHLLAAAIAFAWRRVKLDKQKQCKPP